MHCAEEVDGEQLSLIIGLTTDATKKVASCREADDKLVFYFK